MAAAFSAALSAAFAAAAPTRAAASLVCEHEPGIGVEAWAAVGANARSDEAARERANFFMSKPFWMREGC